MAFLVSLFWNSAGWGNSPFSSVIFLVCFSLSSLYWMFLFRCCFKRNSCIILVVLCPSMIMYRLSGICLMSWASVSSSVVSGRFIDCVFGGVRLS